MSSHPDTPPAHRSSTEPRNGGPGDEPAGSASTPTASEPSTSAAGASTASTPAAGGSGASTDGGSSGRVSRRAVLKGLGIGGGAIVLVGATGIGVRGATNGVWAQGQGAPYELWSSWQDLPGAAAIVAAGVLAANPHNLQPWSFTLHETTGGTGQGITSSIDATATIDLVDDPARATPTCDPDGRERAAGLGCAIQNMVIAAWARGLEATVDAWPDGVPTGGRGADATAGAATTGHAARLRLTPGAAPTDLERALAAAISARHTNRGPYADRPVDAATLDALTLDAPGGATVHWVTAPSQLAALGALYVEATQAIVDDEPMSVEAFSWFRNDRSAIDTHRDGLTLDCQGLDGFTLAMAKILPAQSRSAGDRFWVNSTRDVHTATAAAYGIIRVADTTDPVARLAAGRLLQHVHLAATAAGLGLHHMNQITERIARDATTGRPDVFSARWADAIGIPASEGLLSFRLGHPIRTANPSPRRPLDAVLRTG